MPHKYYHGYAIDRLLTYQEVEHVAELLIYRRTGIVYNVTPNAVGVIVHKIVGNRYIEKRVNLRVEHVRHSGCRQAFLDRVQSNHAAHVEAKKTGSAYDQLFFFLFVP